LPRPSFLSSGSSQPRFGKIDAGGTPGGSVAATQLSKYAVSYCLRLIAGHRCDRQLGSFINERQSHR
jgi:hypothetical protein